MFASLVKKLTERTNMIKFLILLLSTVSGKSEWDSPNRVRLSQLEIEANGGDPVLLRKVAQRNKELNAIVAQRRGLGCARELVNFTV